MHAPKNYFKTFQITQAQFQDHACDAFLQTQNNASHPHSPTQDTVPKPVRDQHTGSVYTQKTMALAPNTSKHHWLYTINASGSFFRRNRKQERPWICEPDKPVIPHSSYPNRRSRSCRKSFSVAQLWKGYRFISLGFIAKVWIPAWYHRIIMRFLGALRVKDVPFSLSATALGRGDSNCILSTFLSSDLMNQKDTI